MSRDDSVKEAGNLLDHQAKEDTGVIKETGHGYHSRVLSGNVDFILESDWLQIL